MTDSEYVAVLQRMRDQYRRNADHAVAVGEYRKVSELLWGALTQQLKILAAVHGIVITSHRQFFEFVRQVASDMRNEGLCKKFIELNAF